jgi:hypothetical protein
LTFSARARQGQEKPKSGTLSFKEKATDPRIKLLGDHHLPLGLLSSCNRPLEAVLARPTSLLLLITVTFEGYCVTNRSTPFHFLASISTASCIHNGSSINFRRRFGYGIHSLWAGSDL